MQHLLHPDLLILTPKFGDKSAVVFFGDKKIARTTHPGTLTGIQPLVVSNVHNYYQAILVSGKRN